ncbi:MAG: hypothetical protein KBA05_00610 [Anaerolineaceae bacterium]|jgi:hypothetical protein|nr:hypothetical protein [Anaerolineaceae bacterium]MDI9531288.1 hypothetical protein [Chloroflexota bacterium]
MSEELRSTIYIILSAALLFALILYNRRTVYIKLYKLINVDGNVKEYLRLLEDKFVKLSLSRKEILAFKFDGLLASGNYTEIEQIIKQLDVAILSKRDRIIYYQKRLYYFIKQRNIQEAEKSLKLLRNSLEMTGSDSKTISMREQAELMFDVYIRKDVSRIPGLVELERSQEDTTKKGLTQYFLAKLYYANDNEVEAKKMLDSSAILLKGTSWETEVTNSKNDLSYLD